ncbi:MAG: 4Fe-4S binding protein [Candidatus Thorarchaeota archaeon]|nr:4Fe-4S binding protein [Candidatus Thorarchaeota archaeon]
MSKIILTRDKEACVKCGECVDVCPHSGENSLVEAHVIIQNPGEIPEIANHENCIGCLSCKDTCRSEAILVEGITEIHSFLLDLQVWEKTRRIL